jgi:hypothetical protein
MKPTIMLIAASLLVTTTARADGTFPEGIVTHYGITCTPPAMFNPPSQNGCLLCHESILGNCGTIVHPLGKWLMANGVSCAAGTTNLQNLDPLLDELQSKNLDTNCDNKPDYEQLMTCDWGALQTQGTACMDGGAPVGDDAGAQPDITENTVYGCTSAPGSRDGAFAATLVCAALVASRRRRSR